MKYDFPEKKLSLFDFRFEINNYSNKNFQISCSVLLFHFSFNCQQFNQIANAMNIRHWCMICNYFGSLISVS